MGGYSEFSQHSLPYTTRQRQAPFPTQFDTILDMLTYVMLCARQHKEYI